MFKINRKLAFFSTGNSPPKRRIPLASYILERSDKGFLLEAFRHNFTLFGSSVLVLETKQYLCDTIVNGFGFTDQGACDTVREI